MKITRLPALLAALALASASALAAPPEGKGKPANAGNGKGNSSQAGGSSGNGKSNGGGSQYESQYRGGDSWDEAAFRVFVGQQHYSGYDSLPPGIRKNLARGKPLPPGIAKRDVPPDLLRRLPMRDGYEWRAVGTDLVLYSIASGVIDQVLQDVFLD